MRRAVFVFVGVFCVWGDLLADPLPSLQRFELANGLFSRGMTDLADAEYRAVLPEISDVEQRTQVLFRLGECARAGGRMEEAATWFSRSMREGKGSFSLHARLRRGQLLLDAGEADDAVEVLALLTKVDSPEHAAAGLYYRAKALAAARKMGEAYADEVRQLVERFPMSPYAGYAALELAEWLEAEQGSEAEVLEFLKHAEGSTAGEAVVSRSIYLQAEKAFSKKEYGASAALFERLLTTYGDREEARLGRLRAAWSFLYLKNFRALLPFIQGTEEGERAKDVAGWLYLEANAYRSLGNVTRAALLYQRLEDDYASSSYAPAAAYEFSLMEVNAAGEGVELADMYQRVLSRAALLRRYGVSHPEALWLLVRAEERGGKVHDAEGLLRGLIAQDADPKRRALASYKLAELLLRQNKEAEALVQFRATATDFPKSMEAPVALMAAAEVARRLGEGDEAVLLWDRVARLYPQHEMADDALYQSGLASMRAGRSPEAEKAFSFLLKTDSSHRAEALFWWAVMLEGEGHVEQAMARYRDGLALVSEKVLRARMDYRLGVLQQQSGELDEAAKHVLAAVDARVEGSLVFDPVVVAWLVSFFEGQGASEEVLRVAAVWVKAAGDDEGRQKAFVAKGDALVLLGREEEASVAYRAALDVASSTRAGAGAALWLGEHLLGGQEDDGLAQALVYFERAGVMASSLGMLDLQAGSYMGLGKVAEGGKEDDEAARYFMGVAVLFDDAEVSSEALHRAAGAFKRVGKVKQAEQALKELQARYPDSRWVTQAIQD